jgi:hypothetical protein
MSLINIHYQGVTLCGHNSTAFISLEHMQEVAYNPLIARHVVSLTDPICLVCEGIFTNRHLAPNAAEVYLERMKSSAYLKKRLLSEADLQSRPEPKIF